MDRFSSNMEKLTQAGFEVDPLQLHVPGLEKEYHFAFLADLHILRPNEEVSPDWAETVNERFLRFARDRKGTASSELWEKMAASLSALQLDALLLGVDMIDYYSEANMACLREGLSQFACPVLYMRDNHDRSNHYSPSVPAEI